MTTAGKVFCVLNVIAAIAFLIFTAPVVQYRVSMQEKIDKERAKVPGLEREVIDLDGERVQLEAELTRQIGILRYTVTIGVNQRGEFDKLIAVRTDDLRDADTNLSDWKQTLQNVEADVAARTDEFNRLTQQIADHKVLLDTHKNEVSVLETRLKRAQDMFDASSVAIAQHLNSVVELENEILEQFPFYENLAAGR